MKVGSIIAAFLILFVFPQTEPQTIELKNTTAEVSQMNGISVFIHCKPSKKYRTVGTLSPKVVWSKEADKIIDYMTRKGHEEFPDADAIIFTADDMTRADLIKFD